MSPAASAPPVEDPSPDSDGPPHEAQVSTVERSSGMVSRPHGGLSLPLDPLAMLRERSEALTMDLAALWRARILLGDTTLGDVPLGQVPMGLLLAVPTVSTAVIEEPVPASSRPSLAVVVKQTSLVAVKTGYVFGVKVTTLLGALTLVGEIAARLWPHYVSPLRAIFTALAASAGGATPPLP